MMLGLSSLGAVHTAFAFVAVVCGYAMIFRFGRIGAALRFGKTYVACTVIACLTSFGIFMHGGFNIAHALGILTLLVLAIAWIAGRSAAWSRPAKYLETLGYTATLFFHMIPGTTETFTRFPVGAPLFTGPDDPNLQKVIGIILLVFIIGMALQVRQIRRKPAPMRRTSLV